MSSILYRMKRQKKAQAEAATKYIIRNTSATYRATAKKYNVPVDAIRARVNYRYGSLTRARLVGGQNEGAAKKKWARPCMSCGCSKVRAFGQYRCNRCLAAANRINDGGV